MDLDPEFGLFFMDCIEVTREEFGVEPPHPVRLTEAPPGEPTQYRPPELTGGEAEIWLTHGAGWHQRRFQLAHEVFHWFLTPYKCHHWVHEMFGAEMQVRAMGRIAQHAYVQEATAEFYADAARLPLAAMLAAPHLPAAHIPGMHGRAFVVGRELIEAVGWERLKPLAKRFLSDGITSDVMGWMGELPGSEMKRAGAVLTP